MKKLFVFFLLAAAVFIPQLIASGWMRTYGQPDSKDMGWWVEGTSDGGYFVAGETGGAGGDTWLLKTDPQGDTLWTRIYVLAPRNPTYCVQETDDKGYILTGAVWLPPDEGGDQLLLLKTDSLGDTLWTRFYGEENDEEGNFVRQTPDGGYIVTGYVGFDSYNEIPRNLWLLKTDSEGDTLWTRTYGGEKDDNGYCVQPTRDGGFIVTGYTKSFGTGIGDLWLLKTDSEGDTLWTRTYAGEADLWDWGKQVQEADDGGYLIVGVTDFYGVMIPTAGDIWLLRTDSEGDTLWTRKYGYAGASIETAYSGEQTTDGGCIMVGDILSLGTGVRDLWLLKTDSLGDTLWTRTFGGAEADVGNCVHQTPDGGYIITGYTDSFSEEEYDYDVWLVKTDSLGYVGIEEEPPVTPVTHLSNWQISTPIGRQITLRYADHPKGFHASVFDACGRKVDEIHAGAESGTITWPTASKQFSPGVYFFKDNEGSVVKKTVLIR